MLRWQHRAMILNRRPDRTAGRINAAATVRLFRQALHCHIIITRDFNMHDIFQRRWLMLKWQVLAFCECDRSLLVFQVIRFCYCYWYTCNLLLSGYMSWTIHCSVGRFRWTLFWNNNHYFLRNGSCTYLFPWNMFLI